MPADVLPLFRYGRDQLDAVRPVLVDVYREVYADEIKADPFFSAEKFEERLTSQAGLPQWEAVVAYDDDEPAGYVYGAALSAGSAWWRGMIEPLPEEDTSENGTRTVAVFEVMVRAQWRGTGLARRIHEDLLTGRRERRATLLVESDHPKVKSLYEQWRYRDVGGQRPFPDAPIYATMVRDLGH